VTFQLHTDKDSVILGQDANRFPTFRRTDFPSNQRHISEEPNTHTALKTSKFKGTYEFMNSIHGLTLDFVARETD